MKKLLPLILVMVSCADGGIEPTGRIASMLITNKSQYALVDLRMHVAESYATSANVLSEPMDLNDELLFYGTGSVNFTFMREKYAMGPILAFTTAEPVAMTRNQAFDMILFDESFRVETGTYVRPDRYDGLIVGDPGPACEWLPPAETSTTCKERNP
jgi:hypothetical protein